MSYFIGGVVPLSSNELIEVLERDSGCGGMQECGRDGGLPNEDERLAVYVDETSGVYEVAGSHGHSKMNSCSWLSRVVLVHAHRPPYDLASRGLGQLDRQGGDVRRVGLARWHFGHCRCQWWASTWWW